MRKKNKITPDDTNRYFADEYTYVGHSRTKTRIKLISYNENTLVSSNIETDTPSFKSHIKDDCINWFQIQGMTDSEMICRFLKEFNMRNMDIRDILTPNHVVKIDNNPTNIFVILNSCMFNNRDKIYSEHVAIIVMENVVITFTESDIPFFESVENSLDLDTMSLRSQESGMLLAFLMNSILVDLIEAAAMVEKRLEEMEDLLLSKHDNLSGMGQGIQDCRHAYLIIRKSTHPLKEDFPKLIAPKKYIIDESVVPVFDDLFDQLKYAIQVSENSKEVLSSLVDLYATNNDLRMNVIMKRLTVVSTLFIPITFLVGVWGMNFTIMPELDWEYGYLFSWITLIVTAAFTWGFMKKKKWI